MSVSTDFKEFCSRLWMADTADTILQRYHRINKRINADFYGANSDTQHTLYVGSYGRGTEIRTSDIDMLVILPPSYYSKYDAYSGNGQSALLQEVKTSLQKTYSTSHMRGDGQVIKIDFADGINFEIVPAFLNISGSYTYPDTHNNGSWQVTNPKAEIDALNSKNKETNKNLKRLCRMIRAWRETNNIDIPGILIDTLAYNFMSTGKYNTQSYQSYDCMSRDFFKYLMDINPDKLYWPAPGSANHVYKKADFHNSAKEAYQLALDAINYESYPSTSRKIWRKIYGTKFPM